MNPFEKKIADQLGAMTLELLKLQSIIEERDRKIAELEARNPKPTEAVNGATATH